MRTSRRVVEQHEDWLNLADAEAPWYSLPALKRALPSGLDTTPSELRTEHKVRWSGDDSPRSALAAKDRSQYIDWLLRDALGWEDGYLAGDLLPKNLADGVRRHEVIVAPAGVYQPDPPTPVTLFDQSAFYGDRSASADTDPRVLVLSLPPGTDPRTRPPGDRWPATWVQRAALLCRHYRVPLALVTDGDYLTLVHAPQQGMTGWGTWRASEFAAEPVLFDSFRTMLNARRFLGAQSQDTPEALLKESAGSQAEVTDQLGMQVRRATELLVNAISRANLDRGGAVLEGIPPHQVYQAAVTVMMRVVFLLVAEENGLLPVDNPHYQALYSIRTLRQSLEGERLQDPEALETRTSAWHRLLATSRALQSGISHDDLFVPAYGGSLFDPDRFPFLEGRAAATDWRASVGTPIAVTDFDVLAILDALLVLRFRDVQGVTDTRRLSYRNVDVEQIGHIYERLLDHGAVTAHQVVLGLKGKPGEEPEVSLPNLEARKIDGSASLVAWLSDREAVKAGRRVGTKRQVTELLAKPLDPQRRAALLQACHGDQQLAERIEPFANLLRLDLRNRPLVFLKGSVYVTETGSRRDSGTAYTTRDLADEVVEYTLAPLCYSPGPQDTPDTNRWQIRRSADILGLKVCDPAVGSGAILVAACRYLADRLIEAWRNEGRPDALDVATAADDPSRLDIVVEARRLIAERCCYGVDRNPMAVEMAKLSMWLTTVAKDRPFTFLDHAIKSGDSLLGISDLEQLRTLHLDPTVGRERRVPIPGLMDGGEVVKAVERLVGRALALRREMRGIETVSLADIERKQFLHLGSEGCLATLETIADILTGTALKSAGVKDSAKALTDDLEIETPLIQRVIEVLGTPAETDANGRARDRANYLLNARRSEDSPSRDPLHWPIAFPEVFDGPGKPGFDALLGNPPFLGGQRITGTAGTDYRNYLITWIADGQRGSADLVAYFFLNAARLARSIGFLATNTIAQGDTSEVGLTQIIDAGWTIHRAVSSTAWPGDATLEIAKVWATSLPWSTKRVLNGLSVTSIDEMLYPEPPSGWRKQRLVANADKSFIGSYLLGTEGFTMTPEEAQALIDRDPRNADVLFPYLSGEDINQDPAQMAPRWVINFFDWPEDQARRYPDCFEIVNSRIRPQRARVKDAAAKNWWRHLRPRPNLYRTIKSMVRVLAISEVGKAVQPVFIPTGQVMAHTIVVFTYQDDFHFGVLTSTFHYRWALRYASTFGTGIRYTPSDVFETFPQPPYSDDIAAVGRKLNVHRANLMKHCGLGLTGIYNLVHDPESQADEGIQLLRGMHVALDIAVRDAYGWNELELSHGFHEVRGQGVRFTFSPQVGNRVLELLLELNRERHKAEVAAGLHDPTRTKASGRGPAPAGQRSLLGAER